MVPREFSKVWCYIAALITLIEAVIWGAFSIYAIGVYQCAWEFIITEKTVSTWSMLDVTYLMGKCPGKPMTPYNFSPPSNVATNFQIWMWIYAVVSAAWIPTCVLLIVAALSEVKGEHGAMLYYPWIGFTASFVALDLAGAVYHLVGVFSTRMPDDYASFTAGKTWNSFTNSHSSADITTWLPSLYVTLFFCRLVVIWIINIALVNVVYRASTAVASHHIKHGLNNQLGENTNEESNEPVETGARSPASSSNRYRVDEFGIPIEEMNNEFAYYQREEISPHHPDTTAFEINSRPVRANSYGEHWHEKAPPIASGVKVAPELNKFEPFSYMAGHQPQLKRNVSRSNSTRRDFPHIPRPDYTVADRRSAPAPGLDVVPNRFRVPSPKRNTHPQSPSHYDPSNRSPQTTVSAKIPPAVPPKKPVWRTHTSEEIESVPEIRYITPKPVSPLSQQSFYARRNSQSIVAMERFTNEQRALIVN